jgi:hypothetical protein
MPSSPFIESIGTELKTRHYSIHTEKKLYWIRFFICFNDLKQMRNYEIERLLNNLAINKQVQQITANKIPMHAFSRASLKVSPFVRYIVKVLFSPI